MSEMSDHYYETCVFVQNGGCNKHEWDEQSITCSFHDRRVTATFW